MPPLGQQVGALVVVVFTAVFVVVAPAAVDFEAAAAVVVVALAAVVTPGAAVVVVVTAAVVVVVVVAMVVVAATVVVAAVVVPGHDVGAVQSFILPTVRKKNEKSVICAVFSVPRKSSGSPCAVSHKLLLNAFHGWQSVQIQV